MLPLPFLTILLITVPALLAFAHDCNVATQIITTFITIASGAPVVTAPSPSPSDTTSSPSSSGVDPSLIPPFGVTPGILLNDGTPRCAGLDNKPIECDCPPDFNNFLDGVNSAVAGGALFPTGSSAEDQLNRLQTCLVVLQNIKGGPGTGVGCPAVATTWGELQNQLLSAVNGQ